MASKDFIKNLTSLVELCSCLVIVVAIGAASVSGTSLKNSRTEYCQDEIFSATCEENHVILMTSARYGRINLGRCVNRDLGYLGCAADALKLMDSKCSGHRHCNVSIMDPDLRALEPCNSDVTWHLQATHDCVKVVSRPSHLCRPRTPIQLNEPSGYLSSMLAVTSRVGSATCPWEIVAPPGQVINITLYNFVYNPNRGSTSNTSPCVTVANLRDPERVLRDKVRVDACASKDRMSIAYRSQGNKLEVSFPTVNTASSGTDRTYFLLEYKFTGCPDIVREDGATFHRQGDMAQVKCSTNEETWYLTCETSEWKGVLGNCTQSTAQIWTLDGDESFPFGILVVVAVGVALGIFLGGTLLLVVSVYMKRRHTHLRQETRTLQGDARAYHESALADDYYRKQQELTELQYTEEMHVTPSHIVRVAADEYKITEYRPPCSQVSYSSTVTTTAPKNAPHVYESPKFS